PAGEITSWNPAANRIYGWPAERILGKPIQALFDESAGSTLESILSELHHGRAVDVSGVKHVKEDGREVIASLSLAPVRDASGCLVGGSLIARDITESHRAQAAIVAGENRFRAAIDQ